MSHCSTQSSTETKETIRSLLGFRLYGITVRLKTQTHTQRRKKTKTSRNGFTDPGWHTHAIKLWLATIKPYLHPGVANTALPPTPPASHSDRRAGPHSVASGLPGTLMEAVQSTTYCPACPKRSTRQTAARPQTWGNGNSPALLWPLRPPSSFKSPTSILHLSSLISITFSLIKPPPSLLHSFLLHLSLSLSLSPEREKQTAARVGLADEFQMTLKGKGADRFFPGETDGNPIGKKNNEKKKNCVK